jgi:hypothetical protein
VYVVPEPVTTIGPGATITPGPVTATKSAGSTAVTASLNVTTNRGLSTFAPGCDGSATIELAVGFAGTTRVSSDSNPCETLRPTRRAVNTFKETAWRNHANQFLSHMVQS